jgi:hypothetical protein
MPPPIPPISGPMPDATAALAGDWLVVGRGARGMAPNAVNGAPMPCVSVTITLLPPWARSLERRALYVVGASALSVLPSRRAERSKVGAQKDEGWSAAAATRTAELLNAWKAGRYPSVGHKAWGIQGVIVVMPCCSRAADSSAAP